MRLEKLFPIGFILILIGFFIVFLASVPLEGGGIVIFPFFIFASGDSLIPAIVIIIIFFAGISVLFWFYFPKRAFDVGESESLEQVGDPAEVKYCITCGATLPRKAKYCWRCRAIQPDYSIKENRE